MRLRGERGAKIQIDRTHFHVRGGRNRNIAYVEDRATFTLNTTFFFFQETSLQGLTIVTADRNSRTPDSAHFARSQFYFVDFQTLPNQEMAPAGFILPVRVKKPARAISWSGKPVTTQNIKDSETENRSNRKDLSNRTSNVNVTE